MILNKEEINELLELISSQDITEITHKYYEEDYGLDYIEDILPELLGYKVELETEGYHKNDGQFVEYNFTFTSPEGNKTQISTDMCLMVGFNVHENVIIN